MGLFIDLYLRQSNSSDYLICLLGHKRFASKRWVFSLNFGSYVGWRVAALRVRCCAHVFQQARGSQKCGHRDWRKSLSHKIFYRNEKRWPQSTAVPLTPSPLTLIVILGDCPCQYHHGPMHLWCVENNRLLEILFCLMNVGFKIFNLNFIYKVILIIILAARFSNLIKFDS